MPRYPEAEWVPWQGSNTYYRGSNKPEAVVLHIMEGYLRTARQWAEQGHFGASWHFSVGRDGTVLQHLDFEDGGYHAGITDAQAATDAPTWPLWKGPGRNVNTYTIGVEHEGFHNQPWPEPQKKASRELCQWLSRQLGIPLDVLHFPPHAVIDVVNRVNDFAPPSERAILYQYLLQEDEVTREEFDALSKRVDDLHGALVRDIWTTPERRAKLVANGNASIEARLNSLESNDGPIGKLHKMFEEVSASLFQEIKRNREDIDKHRNAPHMATDAVTRDELMDAAGAFIANINGENQ